MDKFIAGGSIKLVKKSLFRADSFSKIEPKALKVIRDAQPNDILAITITANSPLKVVDAKVFTRELFEEILAN